MRYSVQQIKYEFLYAIKEFDSDGTKWRVTTSDRPPTETLKYGKLRPEDYVFVGKPAGTPRAADVVQEFFVARYGVIPASTSPAGKSAGDWVILYREKASLPHQADLLESPGR